MRANVKDTLKALNRWKEAFDMATSEPIFENGLLIVKILALANP